MTITKKQEPWVFNAGEGAVGGRHKPHPIRLRESQLPLSLLHLTRGRMAVKGLCGGGREPYLSMESWATRVTSVLSAAGSYS